MQELNVTHLREYRERTYRVNESKRVNSIKDAKVFINERGFIFFWPISGIEMPSLWTAVAGEGPVADAHDDPGHVTWGWKDDALDKRFWYYAKVLRRKATFISLKLVPFFYALSMNYGSPEEDHLQAYREGKLTLAAKNVYEVLLEKGSQNTLDLRREARLHNGKESIFARALEDLQKDFKILPVGITDAGGWRYSYRYDLTSRHFPELSDAARSINEYDARRTLIKYYLSSVGAIRIGDILRLFGWASELVINTVEQMKKDNQILTFRNSQDLEELLASPAFMDFLSTHR